MKKGWLRGILLGVSLGLLLAGGVALAQGFFVEVDQECFECWPELEAPTEEEIVWVTVGWEEPCVYCWEWEIEGYGATGGCYDLGPDGTTQFGFLVHCDGEVETSFGPDFTAPLEELYGDWTFRWWQDDCSGLSDEVSFLFSDDCFAAMFVPEPGTIVLLGSGLAGLAGYASLRLRARRKRE